MCALDGFSVFLHAPPVTAALLFLARLVRLSASLCQQPSSSYSPPNPPLFFCSLLPSRALFGLHVIITSWVSHLRLFLHKLTPTTRLLFPFFFSFLFFFPCPPLHRKHHEHLLCNFAFSPAFKRRAAEPQVLCLYRHTGRRREIQGPERRSSTYYLTSWDVIVALHHLSKRRRGKTLTCFLWGSELRNVLDPKFLSQLIFS